MNKRIVYKDANTKAVSILIPAPNSGMTIEAIAEKDVPKYRAFKTVDETDAQAKKRFGVQELDTNVPYEIVDVSKVPSDRTFRAAWKEDLTVDMTKAREIQMDKIRELRNEKLKQLDIETLKGRDVQAQKQTLRDIPQTFDLTTAKTPDELKTLIPQELKE